MFSIAICIAICSFFIKHVCCSVLVAELQLSSDIEDFRAVFHLIASQCADSTKLVTHHAFADSSLFRGLVIEHDGIGENTLYDLTERIYSEFPGFVKFWELEASILSGARNVARGDGWRLPPPVLIRSDDVADVQSQAPGLDASVIHELTGVKVLHNQGFVGHGASVAVIDVGLDNLHPVFHASNDGASSLRYGVDLVGDDFEPDSNSPRPDRDAYAECEIHGTHTSALIVGRQDSVGFVGVAPGASLDHYRVAGCKEVNRFDDGVLIEALLLAHARQVDVISLSLATGKGPYSNELVSEIIRRITQEDRTICVVSAGNSGWAGPFSSVSPAAASGAVSASAVNSVHVVRSNPVARAKYYIDGEERSLDFEWQPSPPSRFPESLPLCLPSQNISANDACTEDEADLDPPRRLDGCLVLIRRGGCPLKRKLDYIISHGATYALIYDNKTTDPWDIFLYDNLFPEIRGTGSLLASTGQELAAILSSANTVTLQMDSNFTLQPQVRIRENPLYLPGSLYTGGSWGPAGDLSIFPSISSPGGSVWSAVPRTAGGYGTYTGTSISAPYIAGCAALLRSAYPSWSATDIIRALIHTASPLPFNDGNRTYGDMLAPVWQQGGGLVDVAAALDYQTKISTTFLAFNDTEFYRELSFEITNPGDKSIFYELTSVPAATVQTLDSQNHVIPFAGSQRSGEATEQFLAALGRTKGPLVYVSPSTLALSPGASAKIRVSVDIGSISDEQHCPLYSGYIMVNGSHGSVLSLPYGGLGCRMADVPSLPPNWNYTFLTSVRYNESDDPNALLLPAKPGTTFRLPRTRTEMSLSSSAETFPGINVRLSMISPHIKAFLEDCCELSTAANSWAVDLQEAPVSGGFSRIVPRALLWTGRLANGSLAISGSYCLRVCADRNFGSVSDCVETVQFNLLYV